MAKLSVATAGFSECVSKDSGDSTGVCIVSLNLPGAALQKKGEKSQIPDRIIQRNFLGNLPARYPVPWLSCSVLIPGA